MVYKKKNNKNEKQIIIMNYFICGVLSFTVSNSNYVVPNCRMITEQWIQKDVNGSGRGLLWDTIPSFIWKDLERLFRWSYSFDRPWRPTGLWNVEAPTFSKISAHRWRWCCQPYVPAALYPQEDSWYSFLLEPESTRGPQCGWKDQLNWKSNDLIENRTRDLPACSILSQPTTLPRVL
jgi:hypothetical protein